MSKETINFIIIGILVIIGAVSSWELVSTQQLFLASPDESAQVDYAQLERAVSLWEKRKPFSFSKSTRRATDSAELEDEIENQSVTVSVRNGSGEEDVTDIADRIDAINGVEIGSSTSISDTAVTSVSHKEEVSESMVDEIVSIVEEEYEEVGVTVLSSTSEYDVVVTLGIPQ